MIPTEILRRVGRKAQRMLFPSPPVSHDVTSATPAPQPPASTPPRPAVFDRYSQPGDLTSPSVIINESSRSETTTASPSAISMPLSP